MTGLTHESPYNTPQLNRLERAPRLTRIVLTMLITTFLVAALWLLVTLIVGVESSSNAAVRLLIIFGGGVAVYLAGWSALVGFDESPNRFHTSPLTRWYLVAGLAAFVFDIAMLVVGLNSTNMF